MKLWKIWNVIEVSLFCRCLIEEYNGWSANWENEGGNKGGLGCMTSMVVMRLVFTWHLLR